MTDLPCPICGSAFAARGTLKKYCSVECQRRAMNNAIIERSRARTLAARAGRTCLDCGTSIADRMTSAKRCVDCAKRSWRRADTIARGSREAAYRAATTRPSQHKTIASRANATLRAKGHALPNPGPTGLQRRDPPKLDAPKKPKHDVKLPDLANGEGFPGWDGCWSPAVEPQYRALIEKHLGRPDPMKRTRADAA